MLTLHDALETLDGVSNLYILACKRQGRLENMLLEHVRDCQTGTELQSLNLSAIYIQHKCTQKLLHCLNLHSVHSWHYLDFR